MAAFVNHNSAIILLVLVAGVAAMLAWEHRRSWRALGVIAFVVLVLSAGYADARHGPSDVATIAEVEGLLAAGHPVVLEVYSDACSMCLISNRAVDRLERELEGRAAVLRLNLNDDVGRTAARRYGVRITPTFIVFSPDGRELYRESGYPDTGRLEAEAAAS